MNMERAYQKIRSYQDSLVKYYEISLEDFQPLTNKTFKIYDSNGKVYFMKETNLNALNKYQFIASQGISNVLYPHINREKSFVTNFNDKAIYINDYVESIPTLAELKVKNMYHELRNLHQNTSFKRQLDASTARPKFEEITNRLDYKFRLLENFVRSIESKDLNANSMPILGNYQYLLDAKKELVRLQKRIISAVKAKESITYSYLHNKPSINHLLNVRGSHYLTSIENGKMGISSLDMAKLYVENEDLNIDFKSIIHEYANASDNPFYYDYFRYLVLLIYVKRIEIVTDEYVNANEYANVAQSIKRYFTLFKDINTDYDE